MLRRYFGIVLTLAVLLGFLAWAVWFMIWAWTSVDAKMSVHGWTALILGVLFSCVVGFGLMALVFFSSRKGYDEPPNFVAGDNEDEGRDTRGDATGG